MEVQVSEFIVNVCLFAIIWGSGYAFAARRGVQ